MTLTTSGGRACTSSKGVSKVLESKFIITTSSRAFSRTLCIGESEAVAAQGPRISGGEEYTLRPPVPSRPTPSYLSETGMHSDEVGHRRAADDRGSPVTQAPPPGPQDPRLLSQALPPPQAPPLTSSSPVNAAAAWESARAPSAWDTGERRTRGHRRSARDGWRGPLGVRAWTPNFKYSSLGRWLPRLHSSRPQSLVSLHPLPQRILDKK